LCVQPFAVEWAPKWVQSPYFGWLLVIDLIGGRGRNRTYNLSVKSRMLCQLSYASRSELYFGSALCRAAGSKREANFFAPSKNIP
jgi:hypothetical protein